jgi:hypothetical protein
VNFHLKPATQEKLVAYAEMLGVSVDDCLEALVERVLPEDESNESAPEATDTQFQKEHGISVYRTGVPMPLSLVEDTLQAIRRQRERHIFGNVLKSGCSGTPLP